MVTDLKLRDTLSSKVVVLPQPNPHDDGDCSACHPDRSMQNTPGPSPVIDEFLSDNYQDYLCYECHKGWVELHPTNIDIKKTRLKVKVPTNVLPLRFVHEGRIKIVCMTCHDVHYPHDGFKLLRGYSINPVAQPSRFTSRLAFCESCHGDQMEYLTPHKVRNLQTGCTLCHTRKPLEGRPQPLRSNVNALCTYCHPVFPEPHYVQFNPFPDLDQEVIWKSAVPLRDGAYTCITCHLAHGSSPYPAYLRPEYVTLTRTSVRINPHEKGVFCQNCHSDPSLTKNSSTKSPPLIEADVNKLCSRCHASGAIDGMIHPLRALPAGMKQPKDLPLSKDGTVTCITCHQPGCGPVLPENPNFLRAGARSRGDLCSRCHDWTQLVTRDIHAEVRKDQGCDVCHEHGLVAGEGASVKPGPIKADQNFVCLRCHDVEPHPASHIHTVRPGDYDYVKLDTKTFPLDSYRRITCFSCHQTHQKDPAPSYLRSATPETSCRACHPF